MRTYVAATLALLAACSESPEKPTAEPVSPHSPAVARPEPSEAPTAVDAPKPSQTSPIVGEYRVAGVDGKDINLPYGITTSITADRIHVTADCLNFAWRYTMQRTVLGTERVPVEGCARGLSAPEESLVVAFDSVTSATRTPANALELRGPRHTVTLFSQ